jgi:hypothetical protein
MTVNALTAARMRDVEIFDKIDCTLYPAAVAYPNARVSGILEAPQSSTALVTGTYFRVKPAASADTNSGHLDLGDFEISGVDSVTGAATLGSKVTVDLGRHVEAEWWSTNDALSTYTVLGLAYTANDQAVTYNASTNVVAGRVWGTRTKNGIKQVLVERLTGPAATITNASDTVDQVLDYGTANQIVRTNSDANAAEWGGLRVLPTTGGLTVVYGGAGTDTYSPTASAVNAATGAMTSVPEPAKASNIVLPTTTVKAGTTLFFTKAAATGAFATNVKEDTTTLFSFSASKRGMAVAVFDGTAWAVMGVSAP